jgi:hypothetical protein
MVDPVLSMTITDDVKFGAVVGTSAATNRFAITNPAADHGALCDVISDLRCREGTMIENIGHVRISQGASPGGGAGLEAQIAGWAREKNLDAVVWTGLSSNFLEKR